MSERALVVEAATGAIRRKIIADPTALAQQVKDGESLFLILNDDGVCINDQYLFVSELGALSLAPGAPADLTAPAYELQYVAV